MTIQRQSKLTYLSDDGKALFQVSVHDGAFHIGAVGGYNGEASIPLEYIEEFTNMMTEVLTDANVGS